jgi:hypothetical protein
MALVKFVQANGQNMGITPELVEAIAHNTESPSANCIVHLVSGKAFSMKTLYDDAVKLIPNTVTLTQPNGLNISISENNIESVMHPGDAQSQGAKSLVSMHSGKVFNIKTPFDQVIKVING